MVRSVKATPTPKKLTVSTPSKIVHAENAKAREAFFGPLQRAQRSRGYHVVKSSTYSSSDATKGAINCQEPACPYRVTAEAIQGVCRVISQCLEHNHPASEEMKERATWEYGKEDAEALYYTQRDDGVMLAEAREEVQKKFGHLDLSVYIYRQFEKRWKAARAANFMVAGTPGSSRRVGTPAKMVRSSPSSVSAFTPSPSNKKGHSTTNVASFSSLYLAAGVSVNSEPKHEQEEPATDPLEKEAWDSEKKTLQTELDQLIFEREMWGKKELELLRELAASKELCEQLKTELMECSSAHTAAPASSQQATISQHLSQGTSTPRRSGVLSSFKNVFWGTTDQ